MVVGQFELSAKPLPSPHPDYLAALASYGTPGQGPSIAAVPKGNFPAGLEKEELVTLGSAGAIICPPARRHKFYVFECCRLILPANLDVVSHFVAQPLDPRFITGANKVFVYIPSADGRAKKLVVIEQIFDACHVIDPPVVIL
ncbi:MAG: hypothetical protein WEA84_14525 [Rhodovibrionaceae bacterium]